MRRMPRPQPLLLLLLLLGLSLVSSAAAAPANRPLPGASDAPATRPVTPPDYHLYAGNTHSHTSFTWSHGEQWVAAKPDAGGKKEPGIVVDADGAQSPA